MDWAIRDANGNSVPTCTRARGKQTEETAPRRCKRSTVKACWPKTNGINDSRYVQRAGLAGRLCASPSTWRKYVLYILHIYSMPFTKVILPNWALYKQHLGITTAPSIANLPTPASPRHASKTHENNHGLNTHPCCTPSLIQNGSPSVLLCSIRPIWP